MRNKFILVLVVIATVSLTFAFGPDSPRSTATWLSHDRNSILYMDESTPDQQIVALLERLTLTLESPSMIRLGDVDVFRLTVTIDEHDTASIDPNESPVSTSMDIGDVFDSYNMIAEARLELPRIFVTPSNIVSQPIRAGQRITFTWSVPASSVGEYDGTAWFFLRLIPKDEEERTTGQDTSDDLDAQSGVTRESETELPVAAIPFHVRVVSLWGMNGTTARLIGIVGLLIGFLIALPLILDWFYRVRSHPSV